MSATVTRIGTEGGCTMCILPDGEPEDSANAYAAGLAHAETVKGDSSLIDLCETHRSMVDMHRTMHSMIKTVPQ